MFSNTNTTKGFIAKVKDKDAAICERFAFTAKESITKDVSNITIFPNQHSAEQAVIWFNNSHKNKADFEILQVGKTVTTQICFDLKQEVNE